MLLGLVLTVTVQLVTGLLLFLGQGGVFAWHIADGLACAAFVSAEWAWLLASRSGRFHARRIFLLSPHHRRLALAQLRGHGDAPLREGLNAALEGVFMLAASAAVGCGLALWRGHADCFDWHRLLALVLAALWVAHSLISAWDHRPRRRR